jgi:hypothetical protein
MIAKGSHAYPPRHESRPKEVAEVAMVVVLIPVSDAEPTLQPAALAEFARLGVTSVGLVRDEQTAGLVLEGWAFDPARASEAAFAVAGTNDDVRTLQPLMQMAVSASPTRTEQ